MPIEDVVLSTNGIDLGNPGHQSVEIDFFLEVWNGFDWVRVQTVSGYSSQIANKQPSLVVTSQSAYMATGDHQVILSDWSDRSVRELQMGDELKIGHYPFASPSTSPSPSITLSDLDLEFARLSGMIAFHGFWLEERRGFVLDSSKNNMLIPSNTQLKKSDYYNRDGSRRVPSKFLNATLDEQRCFLSSFDPLIVSSSMTLMQGVLYMFHQVEGIYRTIEVFNHMQRSDHQQPSCQLGDLPVSCQISTIYPGDQYQGWFYDLETTSGTFMCGVGRGVVHNSPRRAHNFVTRKITIGLNKILQGLESELVLGNLDAERDWGHARDYVQAMWLILQHSEPDDFVVATNECHTVREFVEKSFSLRGFDIIWHGSGVDEVGCDKSTGRVLIRVSNKYFRPAEVESLLGDSTRAYELLDWKASTSFDELVKEMVEADCPCSKTEH